jgi:hypothetical protein
VLALRRQKSPFPRLEARLAGLDPDGRYEWRSLDKELLWPNEPPDGGGGEKAAAGPRAMEG